MIHDKDLLDQLSKFTATRFEGEVFRATRLNADPLAVSIYGGRWSPRPQGDGGVGVLYTCAARDGALAEVVSFLLDLTPIPGARPLKVTRLAITTARTVRLLPRDLVSLGVDMTRYGERDYARTQEIGAAFAFLGIDALIAPSARWHCDNVMIFGDNHSLTERLEAVDEEQVEWRVWAKEKKLIA
jgi:hypothetical protein